MVYTQSKTYVRLPPHLQLILSEWIIRRVLGWKSDCSGNLFEVILIFFNSFNQTIIDCCSGDNANLRGMKLSFPNLLFLNLYKLQQCGYCAKLGCKIIVQLPETKFASKLTPLPRDVCHPLYPFTSLFWFSPLYITAKSRGDTKTWNW
jgi:hypothetical protein